MPKITSNPAAQNENPAQPSILFAVRATPIEAFGDQHGRLTRKFVLVMLATHADRDGTRCYPSISLLAKECGLCERAIQKAIRWLREHGLIAVTLKAGPKQVSVYTILIPEVTNSSVRHELQRSSRTEAHGVTNSSVREVTNGDTQGDELQSSPNLPYNQPIPTRRPTHKARAPKNSAPPFVLPDWVPVPEWDGFEEMRKKLRKPMTDHARELVVRELAKLRDAGDLPADVLNRSTVNCWQDVYPLKRPPVREAQRTATPNNYAGQGSGRMP